jgi:hypothetical protein
MEDLNFYKHHPPLNDEKEDIEMNFFSSINPELYDEYNINTILPFSDLKEDKYADVIFPSMHLTELNDEISTSKFNSIDNKNDLSNIEEKEKIIEKISTYITNYNNFINQESATQSRNNDFDLNSNIKLAENTLPGSIISLMKKIGKPISKEVIYEHIKNNFSSFRKANGAKYNGNINSALNSTLKTSGIFIKISDDLYYYKEKESMVFIIKTVERELKKKMKKDNKEAKSKMSDSSNKSNKSLSKQQKQLSFTHQLGYKICKLNSILDNLIAKCRGREDDYIKLNKKFDCEGIQMLEKISKQDKYIGMILCIKYFKGIIEKYLKYIKKKKFEKSLNVKKFNEKILNICDKIEKFEFNICRNKEDINNLKVENMGVNQNDLFEEKMIFNKHDIWQIKDIQK